MFQSMYKSFYFVLLLIFTLGACKPQQQTSSSGASTDKSNEASARIAQTLSPSLIWEITGPGLKKPSYLFGTIHVFPADQFFMPEAATQAFDKTERLVLEIDMSNPLLMGMEMMQLAPMKNKVKLYDLMGEEDYTLVKDYFETEVKEVKMTGFQMFESWKPMLLSSMLYEKLLGEKTKAYDMEFLAMAQKDKKKIAGLETVKFQMSVFDSLPYQEQADDLLEMIKSLKNEGANSEAILEFQKMVDAYKTQDLDQLHDLSVEEFEAGKGADLLLYNRNRNWIPQIIRMAKEKPTFFAVGAGHLGGQQGVIRLLMQQGYKVKAL